MRIGISLESRGFPPESLVIGEPGDAAESLRALFELGCTDILVREQLGLALERLDGPLQ